MNWLNYHHLLYFWTVVREGSVTRGAQALHISQPTVSGQLRQLEKAIGKRLYERVGRELRLTETGKLVFEYAEEIFSLGRELTKRLKGGGEHRLPFVVGIPDVLPKLIAFRLIQPVFELQERVQLICHEGSLTDLLGRLAVHQLDLVLSDSPVGSQVNVRAYNHLLGECGVVWVAVKQLARQLKRGFPGSLENQPLLLPTQSTVLRRSVEGWLEKQSFEPEVVAEIEDSALLKTLAAEGLGVAPVATAALEDVRRRYDLHPIGEAEGASMHFYAISAERRIAHPAVGAIAHAAKHRLFSG